MFGRIKQDDDSVQYHDNVYWYYTRYEKGKEYLGTLEQVDPKYQKIPAFKKILGPAKKQ